jgi:hypothetical protein
LCINYAKLHPQNQGETLDKSLFWVINHYNEDNDLNDDPDLEAPDGFPVVVVSPGRIGKRRPVERVRPGQRWSVDPSGKASRKRTHRKTFGTNTRQQTFLSSVITFAKISQALGVSPSRLLEGLPPLNAERTERIKKALAHKRKAK